MTPEQFSQTDHLREDLAGRTTRGGTVMLASQAVRFGLTIVSVAILARLLTPEDYGVIAMVTVVINFTNSFAAWGLSAATMQKPQLMVAPGIKSVLDQHGSEEPGDAPNGRERASCGNVL